MNKGDPKVLSLLSFQPIALRLVLSAPDLLSLSASREDHITTAPVELFACSNKTQYLLDFDCPIDHRAAPSFQEVQIFEFIAKLRRHDLILHNKHANPSRECHERQSHRTRVPGPWTACTVSALSQAASLIPAPLDAGTFAIDIDCRTVRRTCCLLECRFRGNYSGKGGRACDC